jgi:hypothetical protein
VQVVRKSLNEQKTNDATPSADNELTLPVEANSTYEITLIMPYLCDGGTTTQGLQLEFGGPTGWTLEAVLDVASNSTWQLIGRRMTQTSNYGVASGSTSAESNFRVTGTLKTSTTAGNIDVEWAQNTSSANRTQVRAGAFLKLVKIS